MLNGNRFFEGRGIWLRLLMWSMKTLEMVELKESERVKIAIRKSVFGILKGWNVDTQKLKDELREIHG